MSILWTILILLSPLVVGYGVGRFLEGRHFDSLQERESGFGQRVPLLNIKRPPMAEPPPPTELVLGSVVISVDYFKRFLAALRLLVGGHLGSYESLVERARREALLRMREKAAALGATMVVNVRLETASISKGIGQNAVGSVEVLAYGTAVLPAPSSAFNAETT